MITLFKLLTVVLLTTFFIVLPCRADSLPPCDEIPKLLCCTGRVLDKCLPGCLQYVTDKCPHKLEKFDKIHPAKVTSSPPSPQHVLPSTTPPSPSISVLPKPDSRRAQARGVVSGIAPKPSSGSRLREFEDYGSDNGLAAAEGFIEQPSPLPTGGGRSGIVRSGGDYDLLHPAYPVTEVTDADLSPECGTAQSKPPYSPCLARKAVDDLFLTCCRLHVPSSCHALCTYEHREHVAAETLIAAVQSDGCELRYLASVLYCANQNRDNRPCCSDLGLSGSDLGVGNRCLRMCNIARSGQVLGTIESNDLVCLSNWNVIMYCSRAGLRTIN